MELFTILLLDPDTPLGRTLAGDVGQEEKRSATLIFMVLQ